MRARCNEKEARRRRTVCALPCFVDIIPGRAEARRVRIKDGATHRIYEFTGGFWDKIYKGSYGEVRAGATYSYLGREIFNKPGSPNLTTSESIVFTSLRYYPFQ